MRILRCIGIISMQCSYLRQYAYESMSGDLAGIGEIVVGEGMRSAKRRRTRSGFNHLLKLQSSLEMWRINLFR